MIIWLMKRRPVSVRTTHNIITFIFVFIILICLFKIGRYHLLGFEAGAFHYNMLLMFTLATLILFYIIRSHFKDVQQSLPRFNKEEIKALRKFNDYTWVLSEHSKKKWAEGYLTFVNHHLTENPYKEDSMEYISWQAGNAKARRYYNVTKKD